MRPLGKYAELVAAGVATSIVLAYLAALLVGPVLGVPADNVNDLKDLALIAVGAVLTVGASVAGGNGAKAEAARANLRLDQVGIPAHDPLNALPVDPPAVMTTTTTATKAY